MATRAFPPELPLSMQDLWEEFQRWRDRVWHGGIQMGPLDGQDCAPPLDVIDERDRYFIRMEAPGMAGKDVDVRILDNVLRIQGHKVAEHKPDEDARFLRNECRFGAFSRTFELPQPVVEDAIKACVRFGVLTLEIPKAPGAKGRSVTVESGD